MAIHPTIQSMLRESLVEMFLVAQYCVEYRKDPKIWGSYGCYGYPAAILLFAITDAVGSYVIGGKTREHFNILADINYYSLDLTKKEIDLVYEKYRSLLTHNAVLAINTLLDIGAEDDPVFEYNNDRPCVNLLPFLLLTKKVILKFLEDAEAIVSDSKQFKKILKK